MSIRTRKLIGTVVLLVLVTVWALLAMAFAQFALHVRQQPGGVDLLRGRRDRLGAAGHAADQLDVAAERARA